MPAVVHGRHLLVGHGFCLVVIGGGFFCMLVGRGVGSEFRALVTGEAAVLGLVVVMMAFLVAARRLS